MLLLLHIPQRDSTPTMSSKKTKQKTGRHLTPYVFLNFPPLCLAASPIHLHLLTSCPECHQPQEETLLSLVEQTTLPTLITTANQHTKPSPLKSSTSTTPLSSLFTKTQHILTPSTSNTPISSTLASVLWEFSCLMRYMPKQPRPLSG